MCFRTSERSNVQKLMCFWTSKGSEVRTSRMECVFFIVWSFKKVIKGISFERSSFLRLSMFKNTLVFEHRKAEKREPLERNPFYYLPKTIRSPKTTILRERSGLRPNSKRKNYLETDFLANECTKTHGSFNIKIFDAKKNPRKSQFQHAKVRTSRTELGGELAWWVRVQWDKGAGVP